MTYLRVKIALKEALPATDSRKEEGGRGNLFFKLSRVFDEGPETFITMVNSQQGDDACLIERTYVTLSIPAFSHIIPLVQVNAHPLSAPLLLYP